MIAIGPASSKISNLASPGSDFVSSAFSNPERRWEIVWWLGWVDKNGNNYGRITIFSFLGLSIVDGRRIIAGGEVTCFEKFAPAGEESGGVLG